MRKKLMRGLMEKIRVFIAEIAEKKTSFRQFRYYPTSIDPTAIDSMLFFQFNNKFIIKSELYNLLNQIMKKG